MYSAREADGAARGGDIPVTVRSRLTNYRPDAPNALGIDVPTIHVDDGFWVFEPAFGGKSHSDRRPAGRGVMAMILFITIAPVILPSSPRCSGD